MAETKQQKIDRYRGALAAKAKPFNLEEALVGKPLVYRSGRRTRCFYQINEPTTENPPTDRRRVR